ncbi:MAG: hypothetical protein GWN00_29320 [Aliifodinibius sp.]|nr:hypothetical protein [Fodinibius sp.]NIV14871.1 hypothetical protein [Fodinibius sp.]NIY28748.1 hypothetical protein [Fodinibius sp.]
MPKSRRKISAVLNDFQAEIYRLEIFDAKNQRSFSKSSEAFTLHQLHFLTESIFFRAFRAYESFVRDIFLLYCLEKKPSSGRRVVSFITPQSFQHAEELIQSSMRYLDWTSPDTIIKRAEVFLKDGFPIKLPYSTHRNSLLDLKRIRNHLAHDSKESFDGYNRVLINHYGALPLRIPLPGAFLLETDTIDPTKYKLQVYFELFRRLSDDLT